MTGLADGSIASGLLFVTLCDVVATLAGIVSWRTIEKPMAGWVKSALAPPQPGLRGAATAENAATVPQR